MTNLAGQRRREQKQEKWERQPITIEKHPETGFAILGQPKNVIKFIAELKRFAKKTFSGYNLIIDLSKVIQIDMGAICLLLSTIQELAYFKVNIKVKIPEKSSCKDLLRTSGFLVHVRTMTGELFGPVKNKISILKRGKDRTNNKEVGETIKLAVEMITGEKEHYPPIYSLVQEINGNSVEHAYTSAKKEHWMFAINFDELNGKVIFAFADNGQGILSTIRRKFGQAFFDSLQLKGDSRILEGAFLQKYGSRHEDQLNRNKGLPMVRKIQAQEEVKNLFVITNNVFLHLDSFISVPIDQHFKGTFYYWELDQDALDKWKQRIQK